MQPLYAECQCSDFNHLIRFNLDKDDGEVFLDTHLNQYLPWYRRIAIAWRYIFGRIDKFGHYDCTMLKPEDTKRIMDLLQHSLDIRLYLDCSTQPTEKPATQE